MTRAEWRKVKLGELCEISRGSSPRPIADERYFAGGTIPWVKIADATKSGKYLYGTKEKVNEFGASFSRLLPAGSLIIAASGTLGYPQILGVPGCVHDGWLIIQSLKGIDRDFLYYLLQYKQKHFYNMAYGAAIQNINTMILREMEIETPSLDEQVRIAAILSAYDDLIENNTRRIQILEEMGRRIYGEWFVRFRFPGYENVKMVESELGLIPEGWEVNSLKTALVFQRGFDLPVASRTAGKYPVFASTGKNGSHSIAKAKAPGIVTGRSGSLGTVIFVDEDFWPLNTTLWVKEFRKVSAWYAFYLLNDLELEKYNSGAAVPTLNRNDIHGLPVVIPSSACLNQFDELIKPLFRMKIVLGKHVANLRATRDLLLPKLISGE
jgi:type I restriction enzyme S subunit